MLQLSAFSVELQWKQRRERKAGTERIKRRRGVKEDMLV
jgi:hypothetical protein